MSISYNSYKIDDIYEINFLTTFPHVFQHFFSPPETAFRAYYK